MTLVSIIIPTYNQQANFLIECLDSVLSQSYQNIEIIISDNHSTNNAPEIIASYCAKDHRIKKIKPEHHLEMIDHFYFATNQASGEFVTMLSSDDVLRPNCIQEGIQPLLTNPEVVLSFCENEIINEKSEVTDIVRKNKFKSGIYPPEVIAERVLKYSEYWIIGGLVRKKVLESSWDTDVLRKARIADWILFFFILKHGKTAYINKPLSAIRFWQRIGNESDDYNKGYLELYRYSMSNFSLIINDPTILAIIKGGAKRVQTEREKKLRDYLIFYSQKFMEGNISSEEYSSISKELCDHLKMNYISQVFSSAMRKNIFGRLLLLNYRIYNKTLKFFQ